MASDDPNTSLDHGLLDAVQNGGSYSQRRLLIGIAVLGASLAIATIIGVTLIGGFSDRLDVTEQTTQAIQDERARNIRRSCEETNERHDKTIRRLDRLIARQPPTERVESLEEREATIFLLDAIVPRRNCDRMVRRSVERTREDDE